MTKLEPIIEIITVYPFDEGAEAARKGISVHKNPYKAPNIVKTDDIKSEAWLRGYSDFLTQYGPI